MSPSFGPVSSAPGVTYQCNNLAQSCLTWGCEWEAVFPTWHSELATTWSYLTFSPSVLALTETKMHRILDFLTRFPSGFMLTRKHLLVEWMSCPSSIFWPLIMVTSSWNGLKFSLKLPVPSHTQCMFSEVCAACLKRFYLRRHIFQHK